MAVEGEVSAFLLRAAVEDAPLFGDADVDYVVGHYDFDGKGFVEAGYSLDTIVAELNLVCLCSKGQVVVTICGVPLRKQPRDVYSVTGSTSKVMYAFAGIFG